LRLDHLSWSEVGRALARDPRLILPVGALSQHGPHLPLGTNTFIAEEVAKEVSRRTGVLLAPTFSYGVRARDREPFAGAAGVGRKTLHRALNELLGNWEDHGVDEFILLTAHQQEAHLDALLLAMTSSAISTVVNLLSLDVSDLVDGSPETEHGGEVETSLMLYLAPDLVDLNEASDVSLSPGTYRRYAQGRVPTPPPGSRGTLGFPSRASAEKGRAVYDRYVGAVTEILSPKSRPGVPTEERP
jgi:creatinine amidohydrolase